MRHLVPSKEVHARLDQVTVPGLDERGASTRKAAGPYVEPGPKSPRLVDIEIPPDDEMTRVSRPHLPLEYIRC
jgi:hypothetical protein